MGNAMHAKGWRDGREGRITDAGGRPTSVIAPHSCGALHIKNLCTVGVDYM